MERRRGTGRAPTLFDPVDRVAAWLAIDLGEGQELGPLITLHPRRVTDDEAAPSRLAPVDRARQSGSHPVVDAGEDLGRLVDVDHPDPPIRAEIDGLTKSRRPGRDAVRRLARRLAEPEAPVDRCLRRQEDGDRLLVTPGVLEDPVHHPAKHALTAVVRPDTYPGDAAGGDLPAGHRQPKREGTTGPDPPVAIARADEPVELEQRPLPLHLVLVERRAERIKQRLPELAQLVGPRIAERDVIRHR